MQSPDYDAAIIGAGISGLAAAWSLRHRKVLVLEAADRVGGRILSLQRGAYWLNLGAHLFGGPDTAVGRLVSEAGLETRTIPGSRMGFALRGVVLTKGRPETYPFRVPLSLAGKLAVIRMGLRLRRGTKRFIEETTPVAGEPESARRARLVGFENSRTLRDYLGPQHPEVEPILAAITERTSATPEAMSAGHGFASLTHVWSEHAVARNLMGGSAHLPQSIAGRLGDRVRLNSPSTRVEQSEDGVVVTYRSAGAEHRVRARFAVIATPAAVARDVGAALPEDTARALGAIRYGHFLSMAVLTKEKHRMPWDDSYAIATPGLSFGVFFNQASVLRNSAERREGGSLMLFRGAAGAAELMGKSDAEIERLFMRDLEKLFPQAKGIVAETAIQRWPQGAPFAYSGRASLQPALTKPLGRIFLAGDYLEFPSMEAAISTGREAAEKIERQLIGSDDDTDRRPTVGNREHPLRPFLGPEHSGVNAIETAAVQPRNLRGEIHPQEPLTTSPP